MIEIKAPKVPYTPTKLFLSGSIEQGLANDWQSEVVNRLTSKDVTILNPRRDQWDSTWEQSKDDPLFVEQVQWELTQMLSADFVLMYFDPSTKAPVTLLELGLMANSKKHKKRLHVVCPNGYWRKGNVDITCNLFGVKTYDNLTDALDDIMVSLEDI